MGFVKKFMILSVLVSIGAVLYPIFLAPAPTLPDVPELWFGKNKLKSGEAFPKDPVAINKFSLNISNEVLEDLQRRLESARYTVPIVGTQFNYGFNGDYLKKVVDYWKKSFNWRKQEIQLNGLSQYKTQINGINVHFIHVKPSKPAKTVVPLMVIHGFPGSVWEYYKSIPLLTEPSNDIAFEIICPSIPGFGYSDAPQQEGFNVIQTSHIFVKLMDRLGHKTFFAHGGDWGALITRTMALYYPQNVRGIHVTFGGAMKYSGMAFVKWLTGMFAPSLVFDNPGADYDKLFPFMDKFYVMMREMGYLHIQATKPDTVGAALIDSPVGLAAYIMEKFSSWTDMKNTHKSDGALTQKFTLDELLTNVMIYWTSNNVVSSMRYYKESVVLVFLDGQALDRIPIPATVPSAVADLADEFLRTPRALAKYMFLNLVQYTEMPRGGHFAAFEEPKLIADDIKKFVKKVLDLEKSQKVKQ